MAEDRDAVDFHQSNYKKPRVQPLNPSHYFLKAIALQNAYFLTEATNP
jgi:hypothetical protein